jgi:hypothetical protein
MDKSLLDFELFFGRMRFTLAKQGSKTIIIREVLPLPFWSEKSLINPTGF